MDSAAGGAATANDITSASRSNTAFSSASAISSAVSAASSAHPASDESADASRDGEQDEEAEYGAALAKYHRELAEYENEILPAYLSQQEEQVRNQQEQGREGPLDGKRQERGSGSRATDEHLPQRSKASGEVPSAEDGGGDYYEATYGDESVAASSVSRASSEVDPFTVAGKLEEALRTRP